MKLVKIVIVLALLGGLIYVVSEYTGGESTAQAPAKQGKPGDAPGIEEKYGFTTQQIGQ